MTIKPVYCLVIESDHNVVANVQQCLQHNLGHFPPYIVAVPEAQEAVALLSNALYFDIVIISFPQPQGVLDIFARSLPRALIIALADPTATPFPTAIHSKIWEWIPKPLDMQVLAQTVQRAGRELKNPGSFEDIAPGQISMLLEQKLALASWLEPMLESALRVTRGQKAMLLVGVQENKWRVAVYRNMESEAAHAIMADVVSNATRWQRTDHGEQPISRMEPLANGSSQLLTLFEENGAWLGLIAVETAYPRAEQTGVWATFCSQLLPLVRLAANISRSLSVDQEVSKALEKVQQELVHSTKLASIGELAAGIAHDINTPLTCIVGFIRLFLRFLDRPNISAAELQAVRHYLDKACQEVERCQEIATNLLLFARKENKTFQAFSLTAVVKRACTLLQEQLHQHHVEFSEEIPADLPLALGNANQIQQVLINLMVNAKNAMPQGGKLHIRAAATADKVQLNVSDTGIGIAKENLSRLFEPFYTTNPAGKGTGLGLSMSKKIISEHHGDIRVTSEVGKGTTFTVELMQAKPEQEAR